jgi:hypothetical protein
MQAVIEGEVMGVVPKVSKEKGTAYRLVTILQRPGRGGKGRAELVDVMCFNGQVVEVGTLAKLVVVVRAQAFNGQAQLSVAAF